MMASTKERKFSIDKYAAEASWNVRGWLTVAAGFVLFGVTLSPSNSFSILFVPLQESFNATAVETGIIGSTIFTSQLMSSAFAFLLERCLGFRAVVILSTMLCALSLVVSSFVPSMVVLSLTFGLAYGASSGICFHSVICVLLQHFPDGATRGTAVLLLGYTVGTLLYSQLLELTLTSMGWSGSLMVLGVLVVLPGIPASFLIIPKSSAFPRSSQAHEEHLTKTMLRKVSLGFTQRYEGKDGTERKKTPQPKPEDGMRRVDGQRIAEYAPSSSVAGHPSKDDWMDEYTPWREWDSPDSRNGYERTTSQSTGPSPSSRGTLGPCPPSATSNHLSAARKASEGSRKRKRSLASLSWSGDCKVVMTMSRMWVFSAATLLSAMAWCVFIINIGSFFDSVGLDLREVAILLMIMAAAEICGKLYLATVGEAVRVAKIHFLIGQSVIMTAVAVILIYAEKYIAMIFLSVVIGFMRALWMTLPYTVSVEVIGSKYADQAVTVTLFCQGLGNLLGNLPAGAIYDATGSYELVFTMVAGCTLLGSTLYSVLPFLREACNSLPRPLRQLRSGQFHVVTTSVSSDIATQTYIYNGTDLV